MISLHSYRETTGLRPGQSGGRCCLRFAKMLLALPVVEPLGVETSTFYKGSFLGKLKVWAWRKDPWKLGIWSWIPAELVNLHFFPPNLGVEAWTKLLHVVWMGVLVAEIWWRTGTCSSMCAISSSCYVERYPTFRFKSNAQNLNCFTFGTNDCICHSFSVVELDRTLFVVL